MSAAPFSNDPVLQELFGEPVKPVTLTAQERANLDFQIAWREYTAGCWFTQLPRAERNAIRVAFVAGWKGAHARILGIMKP